MKACVICRQELNSATFDGDILELGTGEKEICKRCKQKFEDLTEGILSDRDDAIYYFNNCRRIEDNEVREYLRQITGVAQDVVSANEVITSEKSSSGWIDGMRFIAWLSFGGIIIAGIAMGVMLEGAMAAVIVIGSIILAFVSIAAEMIFLDMAADMRRIRELLERNEKSFK